MDITPVFLFSIPRSGSTLLQRMLSCHPLISTHSELWFLLPHIEAMQNRYSKSVYSTNSLRRATGSLIERLPNGENDYFEAIRKLSDHIYTGLAADGARYVLDKTPRYYFFIPEILRIYPDAKAIFLFRHPFAIAASLVDSFFRGRLGDYRHRVDLFEGPTLLAQGYHEFKERSFGLHYEDLVREPDLWLSRICNYLEIPFEGSMSSQFSDVPVGEMGDQFGSKQYSGLVTDGIEKWKSVFSTGYRQKYLKRYLEYLGQQTVTDLGFDYGQLERELDAIPKRISLSLEDRVREFICRAYSFLEIPLIVEKSREIGRKKKFYMHH